MFLLTSSAFYFSSCNDEETGGAPVIERVRLTNPATADSSLKRVTLGSTIAIVGKNLSTTKYITLNDYPVAISSTYATDKYLLATVLDSVPTVATKPDVPGILKVVNAYGEATFPLEILPPTPVIDQISNEYAKEGETITLYGKYFFFVDTVFFPGGVYTTSGISTSPNGSSLTVEVPAGFNPKPGDVDVIVSSASGNSARKRTTRFFDGTGILNNWDDKRVFGYGLNYTEDNISASPPGGFPPIDGKYGFMNLAIPGGWGWADAKYMHITDWGTGAYWPVSDKGGEYDPDAAIGNFDLKMEIAVAMDAGVSGLADVKMQLVFYNENDIALDTTVPLQDYIHSTDGKWYTFSIPFKNLINGSVKLVNYGDLPKGRNGGVNAFRLIIVKTTAGSSPPLKLGVDNIRVVNSVYIPAN